MVYVNVYAKQHDPPAMERKNYIDASIIFILAYLRIYVEMATSESGGGVCISMVEKQQISDLHFYVFFHDHKHFQKVLEILKIIVGFMKVTSREWEHILP